MRERAALLDGDLDITSEPGAGTRIRLSVPLSGRRDAADETVRLLLAEDHTTVREPIAAQFEREPGFDVIGQVASLAQARTLLNDHIDVAVVDLGLPDSNGTDLIKNLRHANPRAHALVLSASLDRTQTAHTIESGASATLDKTAHLDEVVDAVRRLRAGETPLNLDEVIELLRLAGDQRAQEREHRNAIERLTPREHEVLRHSPTGSTARRSPTASTSPPAPNATTSPTSSPSSACIPNSGPSSSLSATTSSSPTETRGAGPRLSDAKQWRAHCQRPPQERWNPVEATVSRLDALAVTRTTSTTLSTAPGHARSTPSAKVRIGPPRPRPIRTELVINVRGDDRHRATPKCGGGALVGSWHRVAVAGGRCAASAASCSSASTRISAASDRRPGLETRILVACTVTGWHSAPWSGAPLSRRELRWHSARPISWGRRRPLVRALRSCCSSRSCSAGSCRRSDPRCVTSGRARCRGRSGPAAECP
jgi:DNA-binding NarL/FixJ family response regulator